MKPFFLETDWLPPFSATNYPFQNESRMSPTDNEDNNNISESADQTFAGQIVSVNTLQVLKSIQRMNTQSSKPITKPVLRRSSHFNFNVNMGRRCNSNCSCRDDTYGRDMDYVKDIKHHSMVVKSSLMPKVKLLM